tara:strand:- start:3838 stop:4830 length:993 start_codon:yes stop_codon:yes gene_type:complete
MKYFNPSNYESNYIRFFSLGREALEESFILTGIGKGDLVLVPELICEEVTETIKKVNARPVFYKVKYNLQPETLIFKKNIKAVIAVNYFGFPQDLNPFRIFCKKNKVLLIEDNSHGLLSKNSDKKKLGLRADIGIFSFRKTLFCPDGGILSINKRIKFTEKEQLVFTNHSIYYFYLKKILLSIQNKSGVKIFFWFQSLVRIYRLIFYGNKILNENNPSKRRLLIKGPHKISYQILNRTNFINEGIRRKKLFLLFENKLSGLNINPVFKNLSESTIPYGYPFYASKNQVNEVISIAKSLNLECTKWPKFPKEVQLDKTSLHDSLFFINFLN